MHFFGIGASGLVCLDAVQKFRRIGVSSYAHTDFHDQLTSAALLGSKDACVLFTYSGKTKEIQLILKLLKAQNCKIIAVTKLRKTNLLKGADVYLNVLTREVTMRSGATVQIMTNTIKSCLRPTRPYIQGIQSCLKMRL